MRILYVEDTLLNLCLVERIARMGDHTIIHYTTAEQALANIAPDAPDLALVDLRLDGEMDGIELTQRLRDSGYTFPIVAVTANASDDARDRCFAAGCNEYYTKPLLVRALVNLLDHYEQQTARPARASR